ncbi:MAG: aminodeoxychorismate lyase [Lachnospiraceae bacterium]|nr:aminodeoxychorismate lyase [Lachnospiraceae bacterium]
MNAKSLIAAVTGTVLKVAVAVLVILAIYRGAIAAYDYGYRVFEEPAMSGGDGRTVTVTITEDMTPQEMGQLFLSKGLIRDEKLFVLQYYFSEFRSDLKTGDFELCTAMTVEEMMEAMTKEPVVEEPETEGMDDLNADVLGAEENPDGEDASAED